MKVIKYLPSHEKLKPTKTKTYLISMADDDKTYVNDI